MEARNRPTRAGGQDATAVGGRKGSAAVFGAPLGIWPTNANTIQKPFSAFPTLNNRNRHAIREFINWYCSEPRRAFNRIVVTRYRISLGQAHDASSSINLRLAAGIKSSFCSAM